jgi:hypothetical protein
LPATDAKKFLYAEFRSATACCKTTDDTSDSHARSGSLFAFSGDRCSGDLKRGLPGRRTSGVRAVRTEDSEAATKAGALPLSYTRHNQAAGVEPAATGS